MPSTSSRNLKAEEGWGEIFLPRGWLIGETKEGGGEGKRKIRLPAVIVLLGNSVCRRTEFLIGTVLLS